MKVILVRHGQTELNAGGIYRGKLDVPQSAHGLVESEALGRALSGTKLDRIVSSPLSRAVATARVIASYHPNVDVEKAQEFVDMDFGEWQGLTIPEVKQHFPEAYQRWVRRPEIAEIPGGEKLRDVCARALSGLKRIGSAHPEGTVVVVSHGVVNKVLLCILLGATIAAFWNVKQDTGAINIFEYSPLGTKVFLMNDLCHLASVNDIISRMGKSDTPSGSSIGQERQRES
jgi:phosphoserine phosphatase